MKKDEWKAHHREERLAHKNDGSGLSGLDMVAALKEYYDYDYTPEQRVFMRLVNRYKDKLDSSYSAKVESWKPEAKLRGDEMWRKLTSSNWLRIINGLKKPDES